MLIYPLKTLPKMGSAELSSGAQAVTITNLMLDITKSYLIVWSAQNDAGGGNRIARLFLNGDTTTSNYYSQVEYAYGATVGAALVNEARIGFYRGASEYGIGQGILTFDGAGIPCFEGWHITDTGGAPEKYNAKMVKTAAVTEITDISLSLSVSGFMTGAKLDVYMLGD